MPTNAASVPTLKLSTEAPEVLVDFLAGNANSDVEIDLSQTETLSGRHIEIFLSAHRQWTATGLTIVLTRVNETLLQQLVDLGLPAQLLPEGK